MDLTLNKLQWLICHKTKLNLNLCIVSGAWNVLTGFFCRHAKLLTEKKNIGVLSMKLNCIWW